MIAALVQFRKHPQALEATAGLRSNKKFAARKRGTALSFSATKACALFAGMALFISVCIISLSLWPARAAVTMQTGDEPAVGIGGGATLNNEEMRTPERTVEPAQPGDTGVVVEPIIPLYGLRPYPPVPPPGPKPPSVPYPHSGPGPHPGTNPGAYPNPAPPPRFGGQPGGFHAPPPGGGGLFFRR